MRLFNFLKEKNNNFSQSCVRNIYRTKEANEIIASQIANLINASKKL